MIYQLIGLCHIEIFWSRLFCTIYVCKWPLMHNHYASHVCLHHFTHLCINGDVNMVWKSGGFGPKIFTCEEMVNGCLLGGCYSNPGEQSGFFIFFCCLWAPKSRPEPLDAFKREKMARGKISAIDSILIFRYLRNFFRPTIYYFGLLWAPFSLAKPFILFRRSGYGIKFHSLLHHGS